MTSRPSLRLATLLLLGALPLLSLWSFRHAAFVADDRHFANTRLLDHPADLITQPWPHTLGDAQGYRPIVVLSYVLTQPLAGERPALYHLTNFLLHGLNAALLAALVWRLTRTYVSGLVTGLLFAVHPIVHENVVWISGRTYPMAALFTLALLVWLAATPHRTPGVRHGVGLLLAALALASYEFAVVVPFLVLALGCVLDDGRRIRPALALAAPYLGLLAGYLAFRWVMVSGVTDDVALSTAGASGAASNIVVAIRQTRALAFRLLGGEALALGGLTCWVMVVVVVIAMAGIWRGSRSRVLVALFAVAMSGLGFLPVVVYDGYTDRFTYLSAAGFAVFLGTGMGTWLQHATPRRTALALLLIPLAWGSALHQLRRAATEWEHAGVVAQAVLDQTVALDPAPPRGAHLHFFGVPDLYGRAYVHLTYFEASLHHHFDRDDITVHKHVEPSPDRLLDDLAPDASGAKMHRVFVWNPDADRMERRW